MMQKAIENLSQARLLVVKVGSSLVTAEGRGIDQQALAQWAAQIAQLNKRGVQVIFVSSGAIAEGIKRLGWPRRPQRIAGRRRRRSNGHRSGL